MFKFIVIICLLTIYNVNGQAPVLPSYYSRPNYYPTSLYNPQPASYPQSSTSLNAALAYQQEQSLQRQQALAAYQQQANLAALPQSRPSYTSSPSVNYSPQQLPAVNYQQPQVAPQTSYEQPSTQYQSPQTSYNPQGLQTLSYQPPAEQPVAPAVTSYDPQPRQPAYNPQPAYNNPEEIAALQRQRENELALQRQREAQLAAIQRQREIEINLRRQKEAEIALQRERESAIAAQAQRDAIAAQQAAAQQAAQQAAAQRQAAQQAAAQQAAQQAAAQRQAAQQAAAQQAAAQQSRYQPQPQPQSQPASTAFGYQPSRQVAPTTEAPKVVHRPAEIFYSKIGEKLDGDYTFGYHTGKGENDNSFREEKRLPDGTVTGAYGYVDRDGKKHVVKYTAGKDGFKVEGDVNPDIAAASQNAHKLPPLESTTEAPAYQQPVYRPTPAQVAPAAQATYRPQPAYQPPVAPSTPSHSLASYNSQPANSAAVPSEYEQARQQVAANRYSQNERPVASAYQAPISPSYQRQNLSYRPPTRSASAAPIGTHLATSASSASSYPTTARINSRAVRKLLQTRHRQQQPSSTIDTSASVLSSSVSQPVKLKASSSVQILTQPVPPVPNYEPINPASVRMQRARATAYTGNIETSASSAKLSYSAEPIKNAAKVVEQPIVKPQVEKVIESRSEDKIESRSDSLDNLESRIDSPINFPTIALNSFLSKIK